MLPQEDLLEKLVPLLKEQGKLFEKKSKIKARSAAEGELVYTITSDGLETKNQAKSGDMLVENQGQEKYLVSREKFNNRYIKEREIDSLWSWYKPKGKVFALMIDQDLLDFLAQPDQFYFIAPWGEKIVAKKFDYLVCPPDFSEIYRIARKEFGETYGGVTN